MRNSYQVTAPLPLDQAVDRLRYFASFGKEAGAGVHGPGFGMVRKKDDPGEPDSAHFQGYFGNCLFTLTLKERREGEWVSTDAELEFRTSWAIYIMMGVLLLFIGIITFRSPYVTHEEAVLLMLLMALIAMGPPALISAMLFPKTHRRVGGWLEQALCSEHQ